MFLLLPASAYELSGYAWPPEKMPMEIHWTGSMPGFSQEELGQTIQAAGDVWSDASCFVEFAQMATLFNLC
jgi:hypothetical protein